LSVAADSSAARSSLSSAELAMLHEQTLFNPDRTEALDLRSDEKASDEKASDEKAPMDMELIGIGTVGEKSAAVILTRTAPGRSRSNETTRSKHVYMLGQSVADTGYVIESISMREVILVKGDEERTLRLETTDATSEKRNMAAAEQAKEAVAKMNSETVETAKKDKGATPPPPPPPPPVPAQLQEALEVARAAKAANGGQSESAAPDAKEDEQDLSRQERIKRALEARRRILQKRRNEEQQ
jgi:hypothetical protein